MQAIVQNIITQIKATALLEWVAFIFAIVQVVLAWKNKSSNFIAGIISVFLYSIIFYKGGLFAEAGLNVYYFLVSLWGIYVWQIKKGKTKNLSISTCTTTDWTTTVGIALVFFFILFFILKNYTTSTVPMLDSLVSALAWAGTWLLVKRKLENWLVLNLSNLIAIPLLYYKGFALTALLTILFFVIGIFGFLAWRKEGKGSK